MGNSQEIFRLRTQKSSPSRLIDGKRLFAHHGLTAEKARSFEVEQFGDGIIGFTLTDEAEAAQAEPKPGAKGAKPDAKGAKAGGRRKAA